ncbi:MAG: hypothetical protein WBM54_13290, partial [Woeseia sp.]
MSRAVPSFIFIFSTLDELRSRRLGTETGQESNSMKALRILALVTAAAVLAAAPTQAAEADFSTAVADVLALPYNPAAAPIGTDSAFGADDYPAAFPLT